MPRRIFRALHVLAITGALVACTKKEPEDRVVHVSKALAKLDWLRGDWIVQTGLGSEHWVAAGGALYGVAFSDNDRFEVMVIDDAAGPGPTDGELRLYAMPGGKAPVLFSTLSIEPRSAKFANPKHDFPTLVAYRLDDQNVLHAEASNAARTDQVGFVRAVTASRVPDLEAADRAYASSTSDNGFSGWNGTREGSGWIVRGEDRLDGEAIKTRIKPLLDNGTLTWSPIASGSHGNLGYTIGIATFTPKSGAAPFRTSYARIWAKQPDGTWKVRFDTDRSINPER